MGNYAELYNISSYPGEEHSFLLDSFAQFESMARKALHSGRLNLYKNKKIIFNILYNG